MAAERSARFPALAYFGAGASILALAAAIELAMGRKIWGSAASRASGPVTLTANTTRNT
jgi:hypothetical protein